MPPSPEVPQEAPLTNPLNILLDDVDKELLALINQRPPHEKLLSRPYSNPFPGLPDIERVLGSQYCTNTGMSCDPKNI